MGKSPKTLTILCHPDLALWPEVQKLSEQGHAIVLGPLARVGDENIEPDLILHPHAWRMDHAHRKYLSLAIAAGRAKRYPKEK